MVFEAINDSTRGNTLQRVILIYFFEKVVTERSLLFPGYFLLSHDCEDLLQMLQPLSYSDRPEQEIMITDDH